MLIRIGDIEQKYIYLKFQKYFEDSLILQLHWENSIDLVQGVSYPLEKKINFISLVRKLIEKKIN